MNVPRQRNSVGGSQLVTSGASRTFGHRAAGVWMCDARAAAGFAAHLADVGVPLRVRGKVSQHAHTVARGARISIALRIVRVVRRSKLWVLRQASGAFHGTLFGRKPAMKTSTV